MQILFLYNLNLPNNLLVHISLSLFLAIPKVNKALMLIWGFALGFLLDIFLGTIGIQSFLGVLILYIRIIVEPYIIEDYDYNPKVYIHIQTLGLRKYIIYLLTLSLTYHFLFYLFISLPITDLGSIIQKSLISFAIGGTFMLILDYLFFYQQKQEA